MHMKDRLLAARDRARGAPWLVAVALLVSAGPARALTADEIIAKHIEARGGMERLQAIQSLRRIGRLVIPGFNIEMTLTDVKARPGRYRMEFTLQGLTGVQAWDGQEGWQIQPFQGRKDPERMSADDARPMAFFADIDFPFVGYRAKGHTVAFLGEEDVDGTPAYKLRLDTVSGDQIFYFIDPDSWMVVREIQKRTVRGAEQVSETDYGEYEKVQGVWVPMTEGSGPKGSDASQKQQAIYEKAEGNVKVDGASFSFPAVK